MTSSPHEPESRATGVPSPSDEPRTVARRFRLLRLIGSGGQGEVWEARDLTLLRRVALKLLNHRVLALSPDALSLYIARFRREAELASRLDNPHVCRILDFGEENGLPWMAMPLVQGASLKEWVAASVPGSPTSEATAGRPSRPADQDQVATVPISRAVEDHDLRTDASDLRAREFPFRPDEFHAIALYFEKAARALHEAHEAGLIHRDIKPGNMMVTQSGDPMLLDFGLAVDVNNTGSGPTLTATGDIIGTPAYLSPEQISEGRLPVDARSDVYSLGVTIFECLTLERPHQGITREELFRRIVLVPAPSARSLNPRIPRDLALIVGRCLAKNPNRRYATALDLANDLERFRLKCPILARSVPGHVRLYLWCRRHPAIATAMTGLFLMLTLTSGVFFLKNREAQRERLRAEAERANVLRLSAFQTLRKLEREAKTNLIPYFPEKADAMVAWLNEASALTAELPAHRRQLARIRERAEAAHGAGLDDPPLHFPSDEDRWWHDRLRELIESLVAFQDSKTGLMGDGITAAGMWGMRRRLSFARRIDEDSIVRHAEEWRKTLARMERNPKYGGLRILPQTGLVPLGPDTQSGLEEFGDLATGEVPLRDANTGKLAIGERTGVVFVLVPAGSFIMGAQNLDPADVNYDPSAQKDERPLMDVELGSFFISKYEFTQGQWLRLTGMDPSSYSHGSTYGRQAVTLANPVTDVSWNDAIRILAGLGWRLPNEAQWEYACRAGTSSVWWPGDKVIDLVGVTNLAGQTAKRFAPAWTSFEELLDDGHVVHAPVGSFRANPFGLHDMLGNVREWCRSAYGPYEPGVADARDAHQGGNIERRLVRGGSFTDTCIHARCAYRDVETPATTNYSLGLRPARPVLGN